MRIEWALESNANSTTIISLSRKWNLFSTYGKVRPGSAYSVAAINLVAARRGNQSPLKWWSHLSFSDRDGTTSSRVSNLSNQRGKRTASEPSYGTPLVDLKQMLEGDVPQDKMTCLFLVKEGIRKLSDLNTVIGNNTQFIEKWQWVVLVKARRSWEGNQR